MPDEPVLAPRLRELDRQQRLRGMPPVARMRVAERLREEAQRRAAARGFRNRWLPALTFAAGAALVLLVVGLGLQRASIATRAQAPDRTALGMFTVQGQGCRLQGEEGSTVLDGSCRLVSPQLTVHTWEHVVLQRDGGVRLVEGTAMFDVETVPAGEQPVRILVSHGTIDVLGTRFTIEQEADGGFVDLFEGKIRFTSLDGEVVDIAPGQRHAWGTIVVPSVAVPRQSTMADRGVQTLEPTPTEPEAVPVEPEPAAKAAARKRVSSGTSSRSRRDTKTRGTTEEAALIIDEVARLRARGDYARAASVLRRAEQSRRWDSRTAQVLSYELGEILGRHLHDAPAACAHWAEHASRFPRGRYARAVASARERLHCDDAR